MKLFIQKWLGIIDSNSAFTELEHALNRIRDLESQYDDLKYDFESFEYNLGELEIKIDEIESIDLENIKEKVNEVLTDFESMTEGYTVSVKLNPPLS
jgi:archaellum component FlaC